MNCNELSNNYMLLQFSFIIHVPDFLYYKFIQFILIHFPLGHVDI